MHNYHSQAYIASDADTVRIYLLKKKYFKYILIMKEIVSCYKPHRPYFRTTQQMLR